MKCFMLCFCLITVTFSCTKSNNSENLDNPSEINFYALTVGNSWVYKNYKYNLESNLYEDTGVIDSIGIIDVQNFYDQTYYKFRRLTTGNEDHITFCNPNGEYFEYYRESEGNLIQPDSTIKFSNSNFEERLLQENNWGNIYEKLIDGLTTLNVEAGTFNCIYSQRYAKDSIGEQLNGLDKFYYAGGIGLIYDTSSFVSNSTPSIIRRLDSYVVQ